MKKQELINRLKMLDIVADQVSRESLPQESEPVCNSPISVMYRMRDRIKSLEQERILEFCDVKNENTKLRDIAAREHSTNQSRAIEETVEKEYLETQLDNLVQQKIDLSDQLRRQCASEGIPLQSVKNPELLLPMKWRSVQWLARLLIGTGTRLGVGIGLRWPRYHRAKVLGKKLRLECWRELQCSLAKNGGLAMSSVQDSGSYLCGDISLANVPDDQSLLASGAGDAGNTASKGRESK